MAADLKPEQVLQVTNSNTEMFLKNISDRTITAYHYEVKFRYPDGSIHGAERGVDELQLLINESSLSTARQTTAPATSPGVPNQKTPLRPGMSGNLNIGSSSINGTAPVSVAGIDVTMVAFEDGSVIGDGAYQYFRLSRLQALEKESAVYGSLVRDLRDVAASSSPADRVKELNAAKPQSGPPLLSIIAVNMERAASKDPVSSPIEAQRNVANASANLYQTMLDSLEKHFKLMDTANAASAK